MVATPNIQHIIDRLRLAYPNELRFQTYNRRHIGSNPTRPWSQHAGSEPARAWWGNAVDIFDPRDSYDSALLDEVAGFLRANKDSLRINHVLWRIKAHHDHIHVDTWPKMRDQWWYRAPPKGALVTINDDDTVSDTFEEDDVAQFTEAEAEQLRWMLQLLEEKESDVTFVRGAVDLIRKEVKLPLHDPVEASEGFTLPANVQISEIP